MFPIIFGVLSVGFVFVHLYISDLVNPSVLYSFKRIHEISFLWRCFQRHTPWKNFVEKG